MAIKKLKIAETDNKKNGISTKKKFYRLFEERI